MNSDLIILLVGVGVLIALSVLWVWHYLFRKINELDALETSLLIQFEERRDILPYLLESYRSLEPKCSPFFEKIVTQRGEVRNSKAFASIREKERLMDAYLNEFFKETKGNVFLEKDIGWLEARTELQKNGSTIGTIIGSTSRVDRLFEGKEGTISHLVIFTIDPTFLRTH